MRAPRTTSVPAHARCRPPEPVMELGPMSTQPFNRTKGPDLHDQGMVGCCCSVRACPASPGFQQNTPAAPFTISCRRSLPGRSGPAVSPTLWHGLAQSEFLGTLSWDSPGKTGLTRDLSISTMNTALMVPEAPCAKCWHLSVSWRSLGAPPSSFLRKPNVLHETHTLLLPQPQPLS